MQSGSTPCRADPPTRDRQEAHPFVSFQALGELTTAAERREGPGGSCSPSASSGSQKETSSWSCQRDPLAGPTSENNSPSQETHGVFGQAAGPGAACRAASARSKGPQRVGLGTFGTGEAPGGDFASAQEDSLGTAGAVHGRSTEVRSNAGLWRGLCCEYSSERMLGKFGAHQGECQPHPCPRSPSTWRCEGGTGRGYGRWRAQLQEEEGHGERDTRCPHLPARPDLSWRGGQGTGERRGPQRGYGYPLGSAGGGPQSSPRLGGLRGGLDLCSQETGGSTSEDTRHATWLSGQACSGGLCPSLKGLGGLEAVPSLSVGLGLESRPFPCDEGCTLVALVPPGALRRLRAACSRWQKMGPGSRDADSSSMCREVSTCGSDLGAFLGRKATPSLS
eukprot:711654-Amphidinium_carterae.1